jgi:UDP-N-acetyl-2-amino-2-deoxyglucuronate dehydrogenase
VDKTDKIKVAIIGCSHIGKRHAAVVKSNPSCELVALCDTQSKESLGLQELWEVPFFTDIESLLSSDLDIDVVVIATPNGLHEQQALAVLNANKHVIIEKPMALTKQGCERIIYKALQKNKQVFCVMQNRYSPPSVWLKDLVEKGVLGKIFMVQINCYWNRDERYYKKGGWHGTKALDGGTLFTQFSHFIDLMYWCFGDITNINAHLRDFSHQELTEFEDSGSVSFDFVEGGMGTINYSTSVWDKNLESSITVIAENGSLKVGGQYMDKVEYCHIKNYEIPDLKPLNSVDKTSNHHFVIENVVNVLRGQSLITTNALEGMKVVEIIERIYQ